MRDPATINTSGNAPNNLNDGNLYFYINHLMYDNPRKLGRGSKRLGSRGWRLQGNKAPATMRRCCAVARKMCSARMDHDWVQENHRLVV